MRGRLALLAVVVCFGALVSAPPASAASAVVVTDRGAVRGTVDADHRVFQGIPFAAPPVGELRWRSPRPAPRWTGVRDATTAGPECAQPPVFGPGSTAEDCLYLNVTAPVGARKRPVMLWIHGGGYVFGSGTQYTARKLAVQGDVVVVTANYRLGAFGFFAHPELRESGNFGLQDQQAALRWIRRNAAAFGGDPGNVTIFGESAGGRSVCAQLVSPAAAGLFDRAIIQSEPCTQTAWPLDDGSPDPAPPGFPRPRADAEEQGVAVAGGLGCDTAACLREIAASELLAVPHAFGPTYGTRTVPVDPARAVAAGAFHRVPILHGTTRDEYRFPEAFRHPPLSPEQYAEHVRAWVGADDADAVLALYPLAAYDSPAQAWAAVVTDASWARAHSDLNRALAHRTPTYSYEFADPDTPWLSGFPDPGFDTGAFHTAELQYLFDVAGFPGPSTDGQHRLSDQLIAYWTTFARTGNPNDDGQAPWPSARHGAHRALSLAPATTAVVDFDRQHHVDLWREVDLG